MSYFPINLVRRWADGQRPDEIETVHGETVAGLFVHRDINGRGYGWTVSTKGSLSVMRYLSTREQARQAARTLATMMPDEVKSGEWNGKQWAEHDPDGANACKGYLLGDAR